MAPKAPEGGISPNLSTEVGIGGGPKSQHRKHSKLEIRSPPTRKCRAIPGPLAREVPIGLCRNF
eukprot:529501-Alexandrium_andersonii.AAC.1